MLSGRISSQQKLLNERLFEKKENSKDNDERIFKISSNLPQNIYSIQNMYKLIHFKEKFKDNLENKTTEDKSNKLNQKNEKLKSALIKSNTLNIYKNENQEFNRKTNILEISNINSHILNAENKNDIIKDQKLLNISTKDKKEKDFPNISNPIIIQRCNKKPISEINNLNFNNQKNNKIPIENENIPQNYIDYETKYNNMINEEYNNVKNLESNRKENYNNQYNINNIFNFNFEKNFKYYIYFGDDFKNNLEKEKINMECFRDFTGNDSETEKELIESFLKEFPVLLIEL